MKAIIEFDLNDQDDLMAHKRCIKSTEISIALWEIIYNTRKKFVEKEASDEATQMAEDIFNHINEIIQEYNIIIDELIN